jgi:hypothetical protein
MHLSIILSVLLTSALAGASAIPAISPLPKLFHSVQSSSTSFADYAYEKCKELNIDPYGPHPDDFTSDDGQKMHFEEGSKFSYWVSAQLSAKMDHSKKKRDCFSVNIVYVLAPEVKERKKAK